MNLRIRTCLVMLVAGLGLAGCSSSGPDPASPASRSVARMGDTTVVVQRKMGNPDQHHDLGGGQSVWIYSNTLQAPAAPQSTGWSEVLAPSVVDQHGHTVSEAVTREVYHAPLQEEIHVTFKDGVVSAVEAVAQP